MTTYTQEIFIKYSDGSIEQVTKLIKSRPFKISITELKITDYKEDKMAIINYVKCKFCCRLIVKDKQLNWEKELFKHIETAHRYILFEELVDLGEAN